jgi:dihydropyrimidinase
VALQGQLMVSDEQLIAGLRQCRALGALAMVHAENGDAVAEGQRYVTEELSITAPHGHALSRPAALEAEATGRSIRLAGFVGAPLYVVHVMSEGAMDEARAVHRASLALRRAAAAALDLLHYS